MERYDQREDLYEVKRQKEALDKAKVESDRSIELCQLFQQGKHSTEPKGCIPWQLVDKFEDCSYGPMLHYIAFGESVFVRMADGQPLINYVKK